MFDRFDCASQCRTKGCSGAAAQGATVEGAQHFVLITINLARYQKKGFGGARFILSTEHNYSLVRHWCILKINGAIWLKLYD